MTSLGREKRLVSCAVGWRGYDVVQIGWVLVVRTSAGNERICRLLAGRAVGFLLRLPPSVAWRLDINRKVPHDSHRMGLLGTIFSRRKSLTGHDLTGERFLLLVGCSRLLPKLSCNRVHAPILMHGVTLFSSVRNFSHAHTYPFPWFSSISCFSLSSPHVCSRAYSVFVKLATTPSRVGLLREYTSFSAIDDSP